LIIVTSGRRILSIETSSIICGLAYIVNGESVGCIEESAPRKHAEILPDFFIELKNKTKFRLADLNGIAVSIGPGSFTGLRIGLSFAKGLAYSKNLPIIPVPTMMSLAYQVRNKYPTYGLIWSHGTQVFSQHVDWIDKLPVEAGNIEVNSWDDVKKKVPIERTIFQWQCDKIIGNKFIAVVSQPSAVNVGYLANHNYRKWVVKNPYDLVPNYIAPFKIKSGV